MFCTLSKLFVFLFLFDSALVDIVSMHWAATWFTATNKNSKKKFFIPDVCTSERLIEGWLKKKKTTHLFSTYSSNQLLMSMNMTLESQIKNWKYSLTLISSWSIWWIYLKDKKNTTNKLITNGVVVRSSTLAIKITFTHFISSI